jgi:hypothetical protein
VVCQQVTTLTLDRNRRGQFNFSIPVLINSRAWNFRGSGQVEPLTDTRFNLKFELNFNQNQRGGSGGELGGSIYSPLGHYTVMGTTTFVGERTVPSAEGGVTTQARQHLSAFVVYLDRAREFPAKGAESGVRK